jgi:hypothetical protein
MTRCVSSRQLDTLCRTAGFDIGEHAPRSRAPLKHVLAAANSTPAASAFASLQRGAVAASTSAGDRRQHSTAGSTGSCGRGPRACSARKPGIPDPAKPRSAPMSAAGPDPGPTSPIVRDTTASSIHRSDIRAAPALWRSGRMRCSPSGRALLSMRSGAVRGPRR